MGYFERGVAVGGQPTPEDLFHDLHHLLTTSPQWHTIYHSLLQSACRRALYAEARVTQLEETIVEAWNSLVSGGFGNDVLPTLELGCEHCGDRAYRVLNKIVAELPDVEEPEEDTL